MLQVFNHVNLLIGWVLGKGWSFPLPDFLALVVLWPSFVFFSLGTFPMLPAYLVMLFLWHVFLAFHYELFKKRLRPCSWCLKLGKLPHLTDH